MREEDSNQEITRRMIKELNNIRREQRIMKRWGGGLLGAGLLVLAGFLWVSEQEVKQPDPVETTFQYPPPAMPVEEDDSIEITDIVSNEASNASHNSADNTDDADDMNTDNTDDTDEMKETEDTDEMIEMEDTNTVDNTEETDKPEESPSQTESSLSSVSVAVNPVPPRAVINRPVTNRPASARTVEKNVRAGRKTTVADIPSYITTRQGMTLRSLARRYYGSEVFWIYIYDRNMKLLSSPDTLPPCIRLMLPRPADYGIDATEPISLQRACKLAKSLVIQ